MTTAVDIGRLSVRTPGTGDFRPGIAKTPITVKILLLILILG